MGLTLGGYLRRLRGLGDEFQRAGGAAGIARRRSAAGVGQPTVEALLDGPPSIEGLMSAALHRLSMLGTSVGSTTARMGEAVRRRLVGRDRVALALEFEEEVARRGGPGTRAT